MTLQEIIFNLQKYWSEQGCAILQPLDLEVGAGTFHPATFLRALGPEPWRAAYVQPCRRPADGRYGENPNRAQHYYQFQVVLKPSPANIQQLYLNSLAQLAVDLAIEDVRFVEDNWESPTLGAWGLGWEVWLNGLEITQFTYFQQIGGLDCNPTTVEITYGLERVASHLQQVDSIYDLIWTYQPTPLTYGELFRQNEIEMSNYNFNLADTEQLLSQFSALEQTCKDLITKSLPLPAYEAALKASHLFNLMEARGLLATTERQGYLLKIRTLTKQVAATYYQARARQGFPLLLTGEDCR